MIENPTDLYSDVQKNIEKEDIEITIESLLDKGLRIIGK